MFLKKKKKKKLDVKCCVCLINEPLKEWRASIEREDERTRRKRKEAEGNKV